MLNSINLVSALQQFLGTLCNTLITLAFICRDLIWNVFILAKQIYSFLLAMNVKVNGVLFVRDIIENMKLNLKLKHET